jgi:hypothetical protein
MVLALIYSISHLVIHITERMSNIFHPYAGERERQVRRVTAMVIFLFQ